MLYNDSISTASDYSRNAIKFLAQHKLAPHPSHFMMAYSIASDSHLELKQLAENQLGKDARKNTQLMEKWYQQFFATENDDSLKTSYQHLQEILGNTLINMDTVDSGSTTFGTALQAHLEDLKTDSSPSNLFQITCKLIDATESFHQINSNLKNQLNSTKGELDSLQNELEKAKVNAATDSLTKLYNRQSLDNRVDELIEKFNTTKKPFSLLMMDIDFFKKFNDTYGHGIGDEVLRRVAGVLNDSVRGTDFVARYGGEEFTVILPNTELNGASRVAEIMRVAVEDLVLIRKRSQERIAQITISIGIESFLGGMSRDVLYEHADTALYQSKKDGRNRITLFSKE